MSEDETKEILYTGTDTVTFEKLSIPEKIGEQRAYGHANYKRGIQNKTDIKGINKTLTKMETAAGIKAELDTDRHNATTKSITKSSEALTKLTNAIQKQKDDDALEETESLKATIADYENGTKRKSTESRTFLYYVVGAVLVLILTRHLGTIVKMLSGG